MIASKFLQKTRDFATLTGFLNWVSQPALATPFSNYSLPQATFAPLDRYSSYEP
ncbi:MAG: hypothetical protein SFX18_11205 [Pirellulales bacterium]|nr:hypothetical protein [Pirellulales bacterium]